MSFRSRVATRLRALLGARRAARLGRRGDRTHAAADVESFWTAAFERGGIRTWMAEGCIRSRINERITGSPNEWPMEWFQRCWASKELPSGLSIGCGDGALERDVRVKGLCRHITGIDLSGGALERARAKAEQEGLDGIDYIRDDFNSLQLPAAEHDVVFFHQSMHHVAELEHCIAQVVRTLKPDGLLYIDEYVGPSRAEWSERRLTEANRIYLGLPSALRRHRRVPLPIEKDDPSEAIRSSEIVPVISDHLDIIERRDYGGNLLALVHPLIRWQSLDEAGRDRLLESLIDEEDRMLAAGAESYYTVIVARPRT